MKEIWKDVAGYEEMYEVSNFGKVRTHKNKKTWSTQYQSWRTWKQRELKNKTPNGRNVRVTLWKNGKSNDYLVHRLVAQAFIPMIYGKQDINHIDGNPKNNRVDNLEWCNHLENNNHAFDNDLIKTRKRITLIKTENKKEFYFESMAKASVFLGKNTGYLSGVCKNNKDIVTDKNNATYQIKVS